jgi:Mg-chelatase subunit ChlI
MLTIVQSESNAWTVIATDGELRIYSRDRPGEWSALSLSDDSEEVDGEKALMLEELYLTHSEHDEDSAGEEDQYDEHDEADEEGDEPELEEDGSGEAEEDAESENDEEEEQDDKPARRRRTPAAASRGRASSRGK